MDDGVVLAHRFELLQRELAALHAGCPLSEGAVVRVSCGMDGHSI